MNLPPHPLLAPFVRALGTLDDYHTPLKEEHRLYPECVSQLVFMEGESFLGSPREVSPLPRVYLQRFDGVPLRLVSRGRTRMVGVELYPWAAARLFGAERPAPFSEPSLPPSLVRTIGHFLHTGALEAALATLEHWLIERVLGAELVKTEASVAGGRLIEASGQRTISDLAGEVGLSVRQLERQFQRQVGMTPKQLARLARFEAAQRRLRCDPSPCFTRVAHELGYADQAHFTRDFRVFADQTPTLYLLEIRDFWRRQGDVAFLQG